MNDKEKFKNFIYNHPEFIDMVRENKTTWQKLYELYDLYGENNEIWNRYTSNSIASNIDLKSLFNTLKNIDLDNLEQNISSIQKAVGLVSEFTKKEENETIEAKDGKIDSIYGEDNEKTSIE